VEFNDDFLEGPEHPRATNNAAKQHKLKKYFMEPYNSMFHAKIIDFITNELNGAEKGIFNIKT